MYKVYGKYETVSPELGSSMLTSTFYFIISCITLSSKVKALYKIIIENERLVCENKNLLKLFPHSVVIEPKYIDAEYSKGYTNREFERQILEIREHIEELSKVKVQCENKETVTDLYTYLKEQQDKLNDEGFCEDTNIIISCFDSCSSNVLRMDSHSYDGSNGRGSDDTIDKLFNVKTLEVTYEGTPSYMHVFIDTTSIRKLDEAKNNIKLQKIMFASVSHEFRTPLNAIINSFQFINDRFNR